MGEVVRLAPGYSSDSMAELADGLQGLVDAIRSGDIVPERIAFVIHHADGACEPRWFGRSARRYETAGLLFAGAQNLLGG